MGGRARQCAAMRGDAGNAWHCPPLQHTDRRGIHKGCPHCHALVGNEAVTAMMGVAEQCITMRGVAGNAGNAQRCGAMCGVAGTHKRCPYDQRMIIVGIVRNAGQCAAIRGVAGDARQCMASSPQCNTPIVGAPLVGARIARHWQATMAMTAMMGVGEQCITMRGNARQCAAMRGDAALCGDAGQYTTNGVARSRHCAIFQFLYIAILL